jgi:hypothetical protein
LIAAVTAAHALAQRPRFVGVGVRHQERAAIALLTKAARCALSILLHCKNDRGAAVRGRIDSYNPFGDSE